ncbi:FadD3 family acyl-CoA ligase [Streptomyces sp. 4F14]|uniref:FadD3 family acyl-CoA ligase n=1 Tax=Streptomyces sp. 4F14 TaxID=3394380 RepID=UPI003A8A0CE2
MRHDLEFLSIPNVLRVAARRHGAATALVDGERRISFSELSDLMIRSVRSALALGIGPGDRVGLCAPNSAEWILAAVGIQGAGGIVVPLNTRFKAGELAYILRKSGAKALYATPFLGRDYVAELRAHDPELPALRCTPDLYDRVDERTDTQAHASIDRLGPDDVSDIMFTSGTTGHPKGVILTHGQSLRAYGWMSAQYTFRADDRFLVVPPFFHCFGYKAGWLASFLHGVTVIPVQVFDAAGALEVIERERVSILLGPPTIFHDLLSHPDRPRHDLSSLRVSMTGGTTVPESLIHAMKKDLSFDIVLSAYGLTEASALVTSTRPGDTEDTVARTTGRPIPDVEVRIADGEILVRGYTVTRGYWDDPEATAAAIDPDGWLRTGDVGLLDASGNLLIVDRKKEMFIVGGFNAYPAEIEQLLLADDRLAQVAVIGVPDTRLGEVGCAYVVPRPGAELTAEDVIARAREHMANFKVPRHVRFVEGLPRNASQKVLKHELRARFGEK